MRLSTTKSCMFSLTCGAAKPTPAALSRVCQRFFMKEFKSGYDGETVRQAFLKFVAPYAKIGNIIFFFTKLLGLAA